MINDMTPEPDTNPPFPLLATDRLRPLSELGPTPYALHLLAWQANGVWLAMWCQRWDGAWCADPAIHRTREMPAVPTHFVEGV